MNTPSQRRSLLWRRIIALLAFLAITGLAMLASQQLSAMAELGYLGAFLANLIGSATIVLPAPGFAVTFALGGTLPSPLLVGLAAGIGAALGELTGYLAGYSGQAIVEDQQRYRWLVAQTQRYGFSFFFVMALIPNPAFDLAGIAAGGLRYPISRFLLAILPGKTLKMMLIALAGAGLIPNLSQWLSGL